MERVRDKKGTHRERNYMKRVNDYKIYSQKVIT